MNTHFPRIFALGIASSALAGCAAIAPDFDLPTDDRSVPSTSSIVRRITCELVELIRDDVQIPYEHRPDLLGYDYEVAMLLSLDVNDTGGVAPTFNLPYPSFAFNIGATFSQSREDGLNINLTYSMRDLAHAWDKDHNIAKCPELDTNLAGNLGLKRSISAALETVGLKTTTSVSPTDGEFSGVVNFTVTKNINSAGPTWMLAHFTGPGSFGSASRVNSDKLSFGFATGKEAGTPFHAHDIRPPKGPVISRAAFVLDQQLMNDVGTQLNAIRNLPRSAF
jgi:hypothetical protein